jgi:rSAM/selenodomain-associated transferase 1
MSAARRHLVVMVKEPVAGRVKTRLARQVGAVRALGFYRATMRAVIARLAGDDRWTTWLAVAPAHAVASRAWSPRLRRIPQARGDLGRRMQRLMDGLPPGPAVIVGSDIPGIRRSHIAQAFRCLGQADAVFGKAPDGGYWLTGLKRFPHTPRAYAGVRWSTPQALADTLANLTGLELAFAARLADVDDAAGLQACAAWAGRRVLPAATN